MIGIIFAVLAIIAAFAVAGLAISLRALRPLPLPDITEIDRRTPEISHTNSFYRNER